MQPDSKLEIVAPENPNISIAGCDPSTHPLFRKLFEEPRFERIAVEVAEFSEYCLVFTNNSPTRIMALSVVWNYHDSTPESRSGTMLSRSDAYYLEGNNESAVIPPGSQVLVCPKRTVTAAFLNSGHFFVMSSESRVNGLRTIDLFRGASKVMATFDTIVFEDGRVLGPDQTHSVDSIRNRKKAATDIVTLVRRVQEDSLDVQEMLQRIVNSQGRHEYGGYDFWLGNFARMLLHGFRAARPLNLMQFANLPELPDFRAW